METLCALIRGDLAPAGNKISLVSNFNAFSYSITGYQAAWVDSGTSALALALADVKKKTLHVKHPTVIIPGYCCPDLVAAAVYAGVRPVAVDISESDASYDLAQLKAAITENTVAVIAVNFLGIKERLEEIRTVLSGTTIKLIEDNAQWFPANDDEHDFLSDYILFTFGRGKPLSLLGGGVLFSRDNLAVSDLIKPLANDSFHDIKQFVKYVAFNFLLNPHCYFYLNRTPFLHLGETKYHALGIITALDSYRKALFNANLLLHRSRDMYAESAYDEICESVGVQQLVSINTDRRKRLLRYPVLCKSNNDRDTALRKLLSAGLGASPMYKKAISEISGVGDLIDVFGDLKNARHFADRFLTLPSHEYVSKKHIQLINKVLVE